MLHKPPQPGSQDTVLTVLCQPPYECTLQQQGGEGSITGVWKHLPGIVPPPGVSLVWAQAIC
jgi:hypothetical protein